VAIGLITQKGKI